MKMPFKIRENSGFTILEVVVAAALLVMFILLSINYSDSVNHNSRMSQSITTRDRILSGVRAVAGMPAALRASVRASQVDGLSPQNPELTNCVAGSALNSCQNNQEIPFTLYSPTISLDPSGNPTGLMPITAPVGSTKPMRFDTFGVPCSDDTDDCLLTVHTSFHAQCPPAPLPAVPPLPSDPAYIALLAPMNTCTIAEVVTVTYWVDVDQAALAANPSLGAFINSVTGSISTSVKAIYGNDPR